MATPAAAAAATEATAAATQQASDSLHVDAFKRLYADQYYERFLQAGCRPDGRGLTTARPVSVGLRAVSSADGSAIAKVGPSTVLAGVRLEVALPSSEAPDEGSIVISVEMTPLATPDYRPGRTPPITHVLQQRLANVLAGPGGVVRPSDLCIARGRAVWVLYLDIYVLNAAGSLLDAALLAALGALRDTRVPAVRLTEEGNVERQQQQQQDQDKPLAGSWAPLSLQGTALACSCGLYKGQLVTDPDHEEELLMDAHINVIVDERGDLRGVYSAGSVTSKQLISCVEIAVARHRQLLEQLEAAAAAAQEEGDG